MLVEALSADPATKRFAKLNAALADIIEDFPFVGYHTLDIQCKESVARLLKAIDKSNGYVYSTMDINKMKYEAIVGHQDKDSRWTMEVQERYMKS